VAGRGGGAGFCARQAFRVRARQLGLARRLVEVLRRDVVGNDPDLGKEGKPAGACGGQDKLGVFGRQDGAVII